MGLLTPILGPLGTWAVAILAVISLCGLSFIKGMSYEGERRLVAEAKADAERKVFVRTVDREVVKIEVRYVERKAKRDQQQSGSVNEVIDHAKNIPDPANCWLDPRRVSTINASWGVGLDADTGKQTPTVPAADKTGVGKSQ
jgi:hypothetical protein